MINDENIIAEEIMFYITNNKFQPGDKLPSERFFSDLFSVSRFSLRKALKQLINNEYLYVKDKSGYYYCGDKEKVDIRNISSLFEKDNKKRHNLLFRHILATKKIAKRLNIEESTQIMQSILLYNYTSDHTSILIYICFVTHQQLILKMLMIL